MDDSMYWGIKQEEPLPVVVDELPTMHATEEIVMSDMISAECDSIRDMLISKNESYGDSIADPLRIFAPEGLRPTDLVRARIDDKLSRISRGNGFGDEDAVLDLIGYLIILRIMTRIEEAQP